MREKSRIIVLLSTVTVIICLFSLSCVAYAAPAASPKAAPQVQAAPSAASSLLNPNAPPKGTITINASSKANVNASTWYTGSYQYIQWTCNGTRSNLVDVTLWQNNSKVVDIGTGIATGKTAYAVPWDTRAGQYELRVTSEDDIRIEAKMPVTIALTSITITAPKQNEVFYAGSAFTCTWTYNGNPEPVSICWGIGCVDIAKGKNSWDVPTTLGLNNIIVKSNDNPAISSSVGVVIVCKSNTASCNGHCVDLQTDFDNCGWCGDTCAKLGTPLKNADGKDVPIAYCQNGQCQCRKVLNLTLCGGKCVDLSKDGLNCGKCGNSCPPQSNQICQGGSCGCAPPFATMCGNICTNITWDANNCGKCGNVCPAGKRCVGTCQ